LDTTTDKPKRESIDEAIDHQAILKDIHACALGGVLRKAEVRIDRYKAAAKVLRKQSRWSDAQAIENKEKLLNLLKAHGGDQPIDAELVYKAAIECLERKYEPLSLRRLIQSTRPWPALY
jgi:hypothetical protein